MKNFFTFIFLGMAFTAAGQSSPAEAGLLQNASEISRLMANNLKLNEQEYIQIKALTYAKLRTVSEIMDNYSYNLKLRDKKITEVENVYQWQLRLALNARQVEQLLARQEERDIFLTSFPWL